MIRLKALAGVFCYLLVLLPLLVAYPSKADLIDTTDSGVTEHSISDDSHVSVPLPFGFPFYGTTYYHSFMHANGVVSLVGQNQNAPFHFCCNGWSESYWENYTGTTIKNFIAPLWTDLISIRNDSGFFTQSVDNDGDGTDDSMRYMWLNVSEYYNSQTKNTFGLELFGGDLSNAGKIDIHHDYIDVRNHSVTVGIFGPTKDKYVFEGNWNGLSSTNYNNIYSGTPENPCTSNPLYSTSCPGYAEAYYSQQCTLNPLYDSGCPGYATAYYNQQCTADPLYDSGCPGYQTAYYNQQCTADPLYDSGCPGYETAYYNQQCTADPLYDPGCPGYETAYYETYVEPYIETGVEDPADTTTDTTTVETVYVEEDYSEPQIIDDPVIDNIVFDDVDLDIVELPTMDLPVVEIPIVEVEIPEQFQEADPTSDESIEASIESDLGEPVEEETTEVAMAEEPESSEEPTNEEPTNETEPDSDVEEQVESDGNEESSDAEQSDERDSDDDSDGKDKSKESAGDDKKKSKREKIKQIVATKAAKLAEEMSQAATLEAQQAIQNQIFALVNFNSEFKGYSIGLPDVAGYVNQPQLVDGKSPASANRRGLLNGLAQQQLHEKMIALQWEKK